MAGLFVNSLPLLYDIGGKVNPAISEPQQAQSMTRIGVFTGLYTFATQSAAICGPVLTGFMVELFASQRVLLLFMGGMTLAGWLVLQKIKD